MPTEEEAAIAHAYGRWGPMTTSKTPEAEATEGPGGRLAHLFWGRGEGKGSQPVPLSIALAA